MVETVVGSQIKAMKCIVMLLKRLIQDKIKKSKAKVILLNIQATTQEDIRQWKDKRKVWCIWLQYKTKIRKLELQDARIQQKGDATIKRKGTKDKSKKKRVDNDKADEVVDLDNEKNFVRPRTPDRHKRNVNNLSNNIVKFMQREEQNPLKNVLWTLIKTVSHKFWS